MLAADFNCRHEAFCWQLFLFISFCRCCCCCCFQFCDSFIFHIPPSTQLPNDITCIVEHPHNTYTHPHPQRHNNSHYESLWLFTDISAAAAVFFLFHSLIKMKTLPLHHTTNTNIVKLDFFPSSSSCVLSVSVIFRFVHSIWHFIPERKEKKHFFCCWF